MGEWLGVWLVGGAATASCGLLTVLDTNPHHIIYNGSYIVMMCSGGRGVHGGVEGLIISQ